MKRLFFYLVMGSLILMFGCSEDSPVLPGDDPLQHESTLKSAHKPMAKLVGYTFESLCIHEGLPYSVGTIDFGDMGTYGLIYQILSLEGKEPARTSFLTETFYIKAMGGYPWDVTDENFDFNALWDLDCLMTGTNSGVVVTDKMFVTNGKVSEAMEEFEGWAGRKVHVNGDIISPTSFTSTFRVN